MSRGEELRGDLDQDGRVGFSERVKRGDENNGDSQINAI